MICLASLVATAAPAFAMEKELLQNPGFEGWEQTKLVGWEAQTGRWAEEQEQIHSGKRALRLVAETSGKHSAARMYHSALVPLGPQTDAVARVWAKGRGQISFTVADFGERGYIGSLASHRAELTDQWQAYQLAYGTSAGEAVRVRLGVTITGKGAFALLDDASFKATMPRAQPEQNLVPNGNCNTDSDSDARPDHWGFTSMSSRSASLAQGPDRTPAALFQYAPTPRDSSRALDPKTWWRWESQQASAPTWVGAISSPTVPIAPGRTYRISYQTRGDKVRLFHTKLCWLRDGQRQLRWRTIGPKREGRWNWETECITLTAPPADVAAIRIEYWCLAGSGRIWVDNLTVQQLSCRPVSAHTDFAKVEPVPNVPPLPPAAAQPDIRYSRVGTGAPRARTSDATRVSVDDHAITIHLKTGVVLTIPKADDEVVGVTDVRLGDMPLRNPAAPPIAPVLDARGVGTYDACRFLTAEVTDGTDCVVHTSLHSSKGADRLDWIFKPAERRVAGRRYVGFAYQYALTSETAEIDQVMDRATWELGGSPLGTTVIAQNSGAIENVFRLTSDDTYCTGGGFRFAGGDGLEYQMNAAGALVQFFDDPVPYVRCMRFGTPDWVVYRDATQFAGARRLATPLKCVLFCQHAGHDEWTYIRDHVYGLHAARYGIKSHAPAPIANAWLGWWEMPKKDGALYYEKLLYHYADNVLPEVATMGFRIFAVHGIWSHGGCSPDRLEVGKEFGGEKALRYLCDAAKRRGLMVQAWSTTAHLWQHSPLLAQNPHWRIQGPGGKPPTTYCYPEILGAGLAEGFEDYAVKQYKGVRERTGLGCLWLDSYCNFTHYIRCADRAFALRQAEELFRFHGRLSQLGYHIYTESRGTFGVPACGYPIGNLGTAHPVLPEPYTRYGTSCYTGAAGTPSKEGQSVEVLRALCAGDYYYRVLSNKASLMIYWKRFSELKEFHDKIARANHDYNAVAAYMQRRHTLQHDRGVEWTHPGMSGLVLFSYAVHRYQRPGLKAVVDVTTGQDVPLKDHSFDTQSCHTYRLVVD